MIQIRLLGRFELYLDKKRITIPSRAGQSLFAYLTLTAGTPHKREKLAGTFWPDTPDETARKNLRQELWRIRKVLTTQQDSVTDFLAADEYTIAFNRDSEYWLDVAQLERPSEDIESLANNVSVYQGELMPGFYEEWIVIERDRVQSVFDSKMGQLIDLLVSSERWSTVQEQAARWLALGNTPEPAYRALMLASGARGDMVKVSAIYQHCIEELDEKYGIEPSAETRALYDGLLRGGHIPTRPAAQPAGTVTFLFTDIEESTLLLEKLGEEYASVLEQHHEIMRSAIQNWNGKEVDTQGDAFFVTFTRAVDAIQCAAQAQREFAVHPWRHKQPVRVRMGLHTGEPLIASTGYVGMDVHRAARIGDAAHGGQVLLSQTTRELVLQDLPAGLTIRDLGEHRLKDLKFPTPIYQLVIGGLPSEFPPIRTRFTGTEAPTPGETPFKGLQYFDEVDCDLFFGRELLTEKLMDRLHESKFLSVVVGASGSGKSSLVRAGLIPMLRASGWQVHIITPTAEPLAALATELTRDVESVTAAVTLMDDLLQEPRSLSLFHMRQNYKHPVLLVIDQFEELFTLCRDEFEREAFIDNLLTALRQDTDSFTLVLTLRADFYSHLAQYPELRDAVARHQEYIGPMSMDELRRAVEEPAKRGHWAFEPGLVDLILRDVGDEPGALPLLSHALLETWKRRAGHTLTLKGYADSGGVRGAIAHTAESVYQEFLPEEQTLARNIFLRLTELGEGTEDTRRRASFEELMSGDELNEEVYRVLNKLAEARLITLGEGTAEVAHEALIREWPTLRQWLNQDREGLQLHRRLTEAAHEWELLERDEGVLYRGTQLVQAREWAALHPNHLNAGEKAFLNASNAMEQSQIAEREAQQRRELEAAQKLAETQKNAASRLRIRNRIITGVGVFAILLAIMAGVFGLQSSVNAAQAQTNLGIANQQRAAAVNAQATTQVLGTLSDQAAKVSFSRELAAQAQLNLNTDPERSILLALAALNKADTLEAENALHAAVTTSRIRMTLRGHTGEVEAVAYSPDGTLIASAGDDGTVRLWYTTTGKQELVLKHPASLKLLLFSPDGKKLVTGACDGIIRVWDVASGKQLLAIPLIPGMKGLMDPGTMDLYVSISPDGKILATDAVGQPQLRFWDASTGAELFSFTDPGWNDQIAPEGMTFSPDGVHIAINLNSSFAGYGKIEIWDITTHRRVQTLSGLFDPWTPPSFNPDGTRLASHQGPNGGAGVWDVASGKLLFSLRLGVNRIKYSADGKRLLSASGQGLVQVFDAKNGELLLTLGGHEGRVNDVAESPGCVQPPVETFQWCGTRLASAGGDGTIRIWDVSPAGNEELLTVPGEQFALSSDGTQLSTVTPNIGSLPLTGPGSTFTIQQWKLPNASQSAPISGYSTYSIALEAGLRNYWVQFMGKQSLIATGYLNGPFRFWDIADAGKPIYPISCCTHTDNILISLSNRSRPFAAIGDNGSNTVTLWDLAANRLIRTMDVLGSNAAKGVTVGNLYLSPDGERLVIMKNDSTVDVWSVATGEKVFTIPGPASADGANVGFSPDSKMMVVTDCNGTAVVRDSSSGAEIHRFTVQGPCIWDMAISPDMKLIGFSSRATQIFNLNTGEEVLTLPQSFEIQFSADEAHVAIALGDPAALVPATVRVYLLRLQDLVTLAKTRVTRSLTTDECQQYLHVASCPAQ